MKTATEFQATAGLEDNMSFCGNTEFCLWRNLNKDKGRVCNGGNKRSMKEEVDNY
jgi:hypothetical protein